MGRTYIQNTNENHRIIFYLMLAVLFIAPLWKGLFFEKEMLIVGIVISSLFCWYILTSSGNNPLLGRTGFGILDIGVLAIFIAYFISTFSAVKILTAVEMDLKMAVYVMTYMMSFGFAGDKRDIRKILLVIYFAGTLVALVGVAAASGVDIRDGIVAGRISSTFQYPNALGAFLAVIGIIGFYLTVSTEDNNLKKVLAVSNLFIFTVLFGTASRGTFLALPFAYILFILLQPSKERVKTFSYLLINFIMGGLTIYLATAKAETPKVWGFIIIGAAVNVLLHIGLDYFNLKFRQKTFKNKKIVVLGMIIVFAVIVAAAIVIVPDSQSLQRLTEISIKDRNVVERGYFYLDAFKIVRDHPVIGVGGGGWSSIYTAYQSYGYITSEVHNFYVQTWVEAGILGIVSVFLIIAGVFICMMRIRKSGNYEANAVAATLVASIIVIGMQSAVDFTMTYGAIGLMLWVFFGILRRLSAEHFIQPQSIKQKSPNVLRVVQVSFAAIVLVISFSMYIGIIYEGKSLEAMRNRDVKQRIDYLEKAKLFNPFDADNYANLSLLERELYKKDKDDKRLERAAVFADKAVKADRGSFPFRVEKINVLLLMNRFDEATKEADKAFSLSPWTQDSYNLLAYTYLSAGETSLKNGDTEKAKAYLQKVPEVVKLLTSRMGQLDEDKKQLWVATEKPTVNKKLQQYVGKAVVLLK